MLSAAKQQAPQPSAGRPAARLMFAHLSTHKMTLSSHKRQHGLGSCARGAVCVRRGAAHLTRGLRVDAAHLPPRSRRRRCSLRRADHLRAAKRAPVSPTVAIRRARPRRSPGTAH